MASESHEQNETSAAQHAMRRHYRAAAEAVFVTMLWSSSWVIIKFGLQELSPLIFSGLRYVIAALILLTIVTMRSEYRTSIGEKPRSWWLLMAAYGVVFISITQGAQFVGLDLLDTISVSIILNLTPIVVLVLGAVLLKEVPTLLQVLLIILVVVGAMIYFYPFDFDASATLGVLVMIVGLIANALSSIIGRYVNKQHAAPSIVITAASMMIGSFILLAAGVLLEGIPALSPLSIFYILWLSVVNTAFAFTLWNSAMQTLRAVDTTIINSTMLPQITILSIIFLGAMPTSLEWFGLILLVFCVAAVQVLQAKKTAREQKALPTVRP
ncbi:MAG: hypothetical protein EAX81_07025 [Candidatus Thorarchaeota archaeon]|nr:hypothetical protein [Candidatus Thorarchaeota archaeon]